MTSIPSVSAQIDQEEIFNVISNNFSKLAPAYYYLISNWLTRAYSVHKDIDKYIIVIYLINKDLVIFRRNGLVVDYDTFYKDRSCLLYTSPSPRDRQKSRMPSSA